MITQKAAARQLKPKFRTVNQYYINNLNTVFDEKPQELSKLFNDPKTIKNIIQII